MFRRMAANEPLARCRDNPRAEPEPFQDFSMQQPFRAMSDSERFMAYLEPLKDGLLAFARQAVWSASDAEDVLQTALTTAFASFQSFQEGTNFRAWMYKHLQNAAWSCNRKRRGLGMDCIDEPSRPMVHDPLESNHEAAYQHLLSNPVELYDHFDDRIRGALLGLPEAERTVMLLRAIGDFTYREIADITGMPIGTVMAYLCRAREKMRNRLSLHAQWMGWQTSQQNGELP
jgi:RNA polymerase sigma-70 factor (ECF subfamily)